MDKLCEFLECQPDDIMEHYMVTNKNENNQSLVAIKTIKEVNKYGEEIPINVFIKHITEPLNADNKPVHGWYDKELKEDFEKLDEWDKCHIYAENALINKNIKEKLNKIKNEKSSRKKCLLFFFQSISTYWQGIILAPKMHNVQLRTKAERLTPVP